MRWFICASVGLLAACSGETDDDKASETGDTGEPVSAVCDAVVDTVVPAANSTDVAFDTDVTVTFTTAIPAGGTWALSLATTDGTDVDGDAVLAADGLSATFSPAGDLSAETVYRVTATACDDTKMADFLTAAAPVDASLVEGTTYAIAQDDLDFVTPVGIDGLLTAFDLTLFNVIGLQLATFDSATMSFDAVTTILDEADEPVCDFLVEAETDFSSSPFISFGPQNLEIDIGGGISLTLEDLTVSGRVSTDGTTLEDAEVSLLVALEEIDTGLKALELPPCADIATTPVIKGLITAQCAPCSTSTSGKCVVVEATAEEAGTIDVDIAAECATTTP